MTLVVGINCGQKFIIPNSSRKPSGQVRSDLNVKGKNMKKFLILFIIFISVSRLFSLEFDENIEFRFEPKDLHGKTGKIEKDANGDACAVLRVESDAESEIFLTGIDVIKREKDADGMYYFYISFRERFVTFTSKGYLPLKYKIPQKMERKNVYVVRLNTVLEAENLIRADEDLVNLTLKFNESDVYVKKGDFAPIKQKTKVALFQIPVGSYHFKFLKDGFLDQEKDIEVKEDITIQINMEPGESEEGLKLPGIVTITSEPDNAEVFINDQKVGVTPFTDELIPGKYNLLLKKKLFHPSLSSFSLEEGISKDIPSIKLKPKFAFLEITTAPQNVKIYLNDNFMKSSPLESRKIGSGTYVIRLEKELYHTLIDTVELKDGDDEKLKLNLKPAFGELTINFQPENANLFINNENFGNQPYRNSKQPSGKYFIKIEKEMYHTEEIEIQLEDSKKEHLNFTLKPAFGELTIDFQPENANLFINNENFGNQSYHNSKQPSGTYYIKVEKEMYHTEEIEIQLEDSGKEHLNFTLKPAFGELIIKSEPENNAKVYIDENEVGVTPYKNSKQLSGNYFVRIEKEMWFGEEKEVQVFDGEKTEKTFILTKNFGTITVSANNSDIFINKRKVGFNKYSQNLKPGKYKIKAEREKYKDDEIEIFLKIGEKKEISLEPKPRLGSVSIISNPHDSKGAAIFLNDKKQKETTPAVIPLLIGNYDITLKHPKFLDNTKKLTLSEGEQKKIIFNMQTYSGSMLSKKNFWKKHKWLGFSSSVLLTGAGILFNSMGDKYYDEYKQSTSSNDAVSARENTDKYYQYRDLSYTISIVPAVWSLYSWIKEAGYKKHITK